MTRTFAYVAAASLLLAPPATAQPRPSQHGAVSQTVNETTITLEYDRPVARARDLFGWLIEWDVIWTPGANRATWIEANTPFTFQGRDLPAGRYGVWTIPHENEPWEIILVDDWDTSHTFFSFETEVARVRASPIEGQHMETLAFYFAVVGPYETELRLHWGTTAVPIRIQVPE